MRRSRHFAIAAALGAVALVARGEVVVFRPQSRGLTQQLPCEVHVGSRHLPSEIVGACGKPLAVNIGGDAVAWLERPGSISPFLTDVSRPGEYVIGPFVPAGSVEFSSDHNLREGEYLSLISFPGRSGGEPRALFQRPVSASSIRQPVQMPAGTAIAVLYDRNSNAVSLSKPFLVRADKPAIVWPDLPAAGKSNLFAYLQRPRLATLGAPDQVRIRLSAAEAQREPDVFLDAADTVVAVWYQTEPGTAQLVAESEVLRLPENDLVLARRDVTTFRAHLALLPTLTISIGSVEQSGAKINDALSLAVLRSADDFVLRRMTVETGKTYEFHYMPASPLLVVLNIGFWKIGRRTDLTAGNNQLVDLALEPIVVSGRVYFGHEPARAEIQVLQKGGPVIVATDEDGFYSVTLWEPRLYFIDTFVEGKSTPPFRTVQRITADQTLDIRVPRLRLAARVFDPETGKPVKQHTLIVRSSYNDGGGPQSDVVTVKATNQALTELPPVRPGTVEILAQAEGYVDAELVRLSITESLTEQIVEVPMKRVVEGRRIRVQLSNGQAATGTELAAWRGGNELLWRGVTADDGTAEIPESLDGSLILVRQQNAGSSIFRFAAAKDSAVWQLPPAAPPLVLGVVGSDGGPIGPSAALITAWIGPYRVRGTPLAFLTWSSALTSSEGIWIARNLPASPLRVLVTRRSTLDLLDSGAFDALATTIKFPWPERTAIPISG